MESEHSTTRTTGSGAERRRWPRALADWPVTVQLAEGSCEARVRDISRAGLCFYLDRPIPEMTLLQFQVDLPVEGGVRRVTGRGAVVRCEPISKRVDHYEIAVFLHEMAQPDVRIVEEYVDYVERN